MIMVSTVLVMSGQGVISPVLPLFARSFGASAASVGLTLSAFAVARLVLNVPLGMASDRYGRRPLLVAGPLVTGLGMIGSGFAEGIPDLLLLAAHRRGRLGDVHDGSAGLPGRHLHAAESRPRAGRQSGRAPGRRLARPRARRRARRGVRLSPAVLRGGRSGAAHLGLRLPAPAGDTRPALAGRVARAERRSFRSIGRAGLEAAARLARLPGRLATDGHGLPDPRRWTVHGLPLAGRRGVRLRRALDRRAVHGDGLDQPDRARARRDAHRSRGPQGRHPAQRPGHGGRPGADRLDRGSGGVSGCRPAAGRGHLDHGTRTRRLRRRRRAPRGAGPRHGPLPLGGRSRLRPRPRAPGSDRRRHHTGRSPRRQRGDRPRRDPALRSHRPGAADGNIARRISRCEPSPRSSGAPVWPGAPRPPCGGSPPGSGRSGRSAPSRRSPRSR